MRGLSHLLVFVADLPRMTRFYSGVFGLVPSPSTDSGFVHLTSPVGGAGVALHSVPPHVLGPLASPPSWREDTALKGCFPVEDLRAARDAVLREGGQAKEPWAWEGRQFCECADPEGNVVQIFEQPHPP